MRYIVMPISFSNAVCFIFIIFILKVMNKTEMRRELRIVAREAQNKQIFLCFLNCGYYKDFLTMYFFYRCNISSLLKKICNGVYY